MSRKVDRVNLPITITLTPKALEAVSILKEQFKEEKVSRVIDTIIENYMLSVGYTQIDKEEKMIEVQIISEKKELAKHTHNDSKYVEVPVEGEYIIKLYNPYGVRKLAVVSVDGVNVVSGEEASYNGNGYVLNPFQTLEIKGWRRTENDVAAFTFEKLKKSYASQMGFSESNVGSIGIAVFAEKVEPRYDYWIHYNKPIIRTNDSWTLNSPYQDQVLSRSFNNSIPAAGSASSSTYSAEPQLINESSVTLDSDNYAMPLGGTTYQANSIMPTADSGPVGTGYGQEVEMKIQYVDFSRASETPESVIKLVYATTAQLKSWGVIKEPVIPQPNPFPAEKHPSVEAPPGWEPRPSWKTSSRKYC